MTYALPAVPNVTATAHVLRGALGDVLAQVNHTPLPTPERLFLPKSFERALGRDELLVVGPTGSGKRLLSRLLASTSHRRPMAALAPDARIDVDTRVFALDAGRGDDPAALLTRLADRTHSRLASLALLATAAGVIPADHNRAWTARLAWVDAHADEIPQRLAEADAELDAAGADLIVLVSGFETACATRAAGRRSLDGLLTSLPELVRTLGLRRIVLKLIVRDDLVDPTRHASSSPAGRVIARRCVLRWPLHDLHGLLWHLLTTHPKHGELFRHLAFRCLVRASLGRSALASLVPQALRELSVPAAWCLPSEAYFDANMQEALFHGLTGPFMGESARKGFPYRWLPTHLADAHGDISPRSFLSALATAVAHTADHHADHDFAIHFRSLHAGVHEASRIRVGEIAEHPWVQPLMAALAGHVAVPFEFADAEARWQEADALSHADVVAAEIDSADSARKRLAELGVWREMKTGRIDVPDIFRLGFRLARRGGVPLRRDGEVR